MVEAAPADSPGTSLGLLRFWGFGALEAGHIWHIVPPSGDDGHQATPALCGTRRAALVRGAVAVHRGLLCRRCLARWRARQAAGIR